MRLLSSKIALLVVTCALTPLLAVSACGGDEFQAATGAGAGRGATSGTTSSAGSSSGGSTTSPSVSCSGAEDCNDGDACTRDRCNADGTCDASPMCAANELCCNGDCAQCCDAADCDDGVACTKNTCFAGQCMYVPDDSTCESTEYCSTKDGCRAKQVCGLVDNEDVSQVCDDGSPCTSDACVKNFCEHAFCVTGSEQGGLCCPDKGCAKDCCIDSQCDKDDDPCTVGSCGPDGTCSQVPLCRNGEECCPSADKQTATCGACCSAADCDDKLGCTEDKCGGGQCSNTPDDERCDNGFFCDPTPGKGCQKAAACKQAEDCTPPSPCQSNPNCSAGQCEFDNCPMGTKCCANGCGVCCDDAECNDGVACTKDTCGSTGCSHTPDNSQCGTGGKCAPEVGGCVECLRAADCDDGSECTTDVCTETNSCLHASACPKGQFCSEGRCVECQLDSDCQGGALLEAAPGIVAGCTVSRCVKGMCQDTTEVCSGLQMCCPPFGCAIHCLIPL